MKLTIAQLRDPTGIEGLISGPDPEHQQHYGRGEHFVTRAAPGFLLRHLQGSGAVRHPMVGELRWCRDSGKGALRCKDRAFWKMEDDGHMVYDEDNPEFDLERKGES